MNYANQNPYEYAYAPTTSAQLADEWARTTFIRRTYTHLALAIGAFAGIEMLVFALIPPEALGNLVGAAVSGWNWLFVIGAFMAVSFVANRWAQSSTSLGMQYAGLILYVAAEALIFVPLLFIASRFPGAIPTAAVMTGIVFGGLTAMVFLTKADFSWLGRYLCLAGFAFMGLIVCSMIFGFSLGMLFAAAGVALAAGYVLYDTSNVLHHYRTNQYVAASLALFSSVAVLFWYVLRIVMEMSSRD